MTPAPPYRTRIEEVPLERGLREDEGRIDMQVQFLIGAHNAGAQQLVVGRTMLPPGARHERHLHPNCDEFLVVLSGRGQIYTNTGRELSSAAQERDRFSEAVGHLDGRGITPTRAHTGCSSGGTGCGALGSAYRPAGERSDPCSAAAVSATWRTFPRARGPRSSERSSTSSRHPR